MLLLFKDIAFLAAKDLIVNCIEVREKRVLETLMIVLSGHFISCAIEEFTLFMKKFEISRFCFPVFI